MLLSANLGYSLLVLAILGYFTLSYFWFFFFFFKAIFDYLKLFHVRLLSIVIMTKNPYWVNIYVT
jgi:hypothetical protein